MLLCVVTILVIGVYSSILIDITLITLLVLIIRVLIVVLCDVFFLLLLVLVLFVFISPCLVFLYVLLRKSQQNNDILEIATNNEN